MYWSETREICQQYVKKDYSEQPAQSGQNHPGYYQDSMEPGEFINWKVKTLVRPRERAG